MLLGLSSPAKFVPDDKRFIHNFSASFSLIPGNIFRISSDAEECLLQGRGDAEVSEKLFEVERYAKIKSSF